MKKTYLLTLLLIGAFAHSTTVRFGLKAGTITIDNKDSLSEAVLPLKCYFSSGFAGRKIKITTLNSKTTLLPEKTFRAESGDVPKEGNDFLVLINADRSTNFEDESVRLDSFLIKIDNTDFPVMLKKTKTAELVPGPLAVPKTPPKEEDYQPGYLYYDAMALVDPDVSPQTKAVILKAYKVVAADTVTNKYLAVVGQGPFVKAQGAGLSSLLTSVGSTDVTAAASGLARLIAERAKEELNEAFFRRMKKQLSYYPELSTAFPRTTSLLNMLETFSYTSVIQMLREAFEVDIRNLPEDLYRIKKLDPTACAGIGKDNKKEDCETRMKIIQDFFQSPEGKWTGLAMYTAKEAITNSSNPAVLLKSVVESEDMKEVKTSTENDRPNYNITSSIELSNLLSQSMLCKEEDRIWIDSKQLTALFKTKNAFKAYLGLLIATEKMKGDKNIRFYKNDVKEPITVQDILLKNYSTYEDYQSLIQNSHNAFNAANNAVKKIKNTTDAGGPTETDLSALHSYYNTFTASIKPVVQNPILKGMVGDQIEAKYVLVESYLTPAVDMAYHISVKQYTSAIYDASVLIGKFTKDKKDMTPVSRSFMQYGTLISTVANAKTSDEVKEALEASVLPVGSSAIKRNSSWSFTVNSYVGAYYGWGKMSTQDTNWNAATNKVDTAYTTSPYTSYGLYAPVGLTFSKGSKCGWGLSLTGQLIDLGALVNFYTLEGDKAALPTDFKVSLSNIFAPGAQLAINFPRIPVSLTGGTQMVPALNNISQIVSDPNIKPSSLWRWQVGLVVDIPLYNLKVWDFKK